MTMLEKQKAVELWEEAKSLLASKITNPTFSTWIEPIEAKSFLDNELILITGQSFSIHIVYKNHYDQILEVLQEIKKERISFKIELDEDLTKKQKKRSQALKKESSVISESVINNMKQMNSSPNLNLKYTFENFVVGNNNKLAFMAASAVAEHPSTKYNPLFIYGGSGLGKTHLMQAIGHYILYNHNLRVKYVKTEEFTNDLINSLRFGADKNDKMNRFREKYRNVDVLLIDDIQFIESKGRTEEEIFNTFDALHNSQKQIVITSDRLPKDIPGLHERLRTRFEWGLVCDIQVPDIETRMAILTNLAEKSEIKVSYEVIEFLATVFDSNIRELEGAFNRVTAWSSINDTFLTVEQVKKIINYNETKRNITIELVIETIADYFKLSNDDIIGSSRVQRIALARQIAIYLAREITQLSYPSIGEVFKKKHTTILYSYEQIKKQMEVDKNLKNEINTLQNLIKNKK